MGIDQKLNQQVPLDLEFRDETGKTVRLGDYLGAKPSVLALVYYQCPMLCTMVLNGLLESLKQLKFDVADQFNVVTVSFDPSEKPSLFAHATAIMVLTPQGRLARYFYGIRYPAGDLRLALVEASAGKIGSPVDQVLLYCCQYNPATGKYGFIISRVIQIAGLITILSLGTLIFVMSRGGRRSVKTGFGERMVHDE